MEPRDSRKQWAPRGNFFITAPNKTQVWQVAWGTQWQMAPEAQGHAKGHTSPDRRWAKVPTVPAGGGGPPLRDDPKFCDSCILLTTVL